VVVATAAAPEEEDDDNYDVDEWIDAYNDVIRMNS